MPLNRKTSLGIAAGALLLLLALLVPGPAWIRLFQVPPPELVETLLAGAFLFRLGLAAGGLFVLAGTAAGWWWTAPASVAPRRPWHGTELRILTAILAAALLLRLLFLGRGLWLDEILTLIYYAREPFGEIATFYESQNQNILYSLLAHASLLVFGENAWALRLPAVAFGVASVAALYVFGREVAGAAEAFMATALTTVSYHHIWFSQNARGYTGLLFFTLLSSWLFLRGMKERQPHLWLLYAVTAALGLYVHMTMLFTLAGQFLVYAAAVIIPSSAGWLVGQRPSGTTAGRWTPLFLGFGVAGLIGFQLYAFTVPQIITAAGVDVTHVESWISPLWTIQETVRGLNLGLGKGLAALVALAVVGAGCVSYLKDEPLVVWMLVLPSTMVSVLMIGLAHPLWPRYFFFAMGFGVLVAIRGLLATTRLGVKLAGAPREYAKVLATAAVVILIIGSAATLASVYRPKQDYTGAQVYVESARQPGDVVVSVGLAAKVYDHLAPGWETAETLDELIRLRGGARRTWLLYTLEPHMATEYAEILTLAEDEFELQERFHGSLGGGTVHVYRWVSESAP